MNDQVVYPDLSPKNAVLGLAVGKTARARRGHTVEITKSFKVGEDEVFVDNNGYQYRADGKRFYPFVGSPWDLVEVINISDWVDPALTSVVLRALEGFPVLSGRCTSMHAEHILRELKRAGVDRVAVPAVNPLTQRVEELEKALRQTRSLVTACAITGFTENRDVHRLFTNNGAITKLVPLRSEDRSSIVAD